MKIVHICNFFNPGGSALACYEHAKHREDDAQLFIGCRKGIFKNKFNKLGRTYLYGNLPQLNYKLESISFLYDFKPDIIHIYLPGHENPPYLQYLPKEAKKVCTILCGQQIGFNPHHFDHLIFISKYNQRLSEPILKEKRYKNYSIIRYGLSNLKKEPEFTKNKQIVFGRVSAFCPSKKIEDTIECARKCPNSKFIIGGEVLDRKYCNSLKRTIEDKKIKNVSIFENISEKVKEEIYNSIDVLHYPTSNEAFCFSILEGMQRKKAIISYHDSAIPELNHDYSFFLEEDLSDLIHITYKLQNSSMETIQKLGQISREIYERYYTSEMYYKNIDNLYKNLLMND